MKNRKILTSILLILSIGLMFGVVSAQTCIDYDFNCDGKTTNADLDVIAKYWQNGTQITINVVTGAKCEPLVNFLAPYWQQNLNNGQVAMNDVTLAGKKIAKCIPDCSLLKCPHSYFDEALQECACGSLNNTESNATSSSESNISINTESNATSSSESNISIKIIYPKEGQEPIVMEKNETSESSIKEGQSSLIICNGCEMDKKCYPFGYRKSDKFCSDSGSFIEQLKSEETCDNNWECSSNVCVSGKCIPDSFIQKILNWFAKIFGKE